MDSMVALDFLSNVPARDITAVYVNHGTEYANDAAQFVKEQCEKRGVNFYTNAMHAKLNIISSNREEQWRDMRYEVFDMFSAKNAMPLITMHHLDDCLETWLFSSFNGKPKTIQYKRGRVIRPFLLTKHVDIERYAENNNVEYLNDPSNNDISFMRNRIRHNIVPEVLKVNPGIHKTLAKIVEKRYNILYG